MRRRTQLLAALGIVLVGLVAEAVRYPLSDVGPAATDALTGWTIAGCGLLAWRGRPDSRLGPLLTCTGLAWFAGNFSAVPATGLATLASAVALVYLGFLAHSILAYPSGRATTNLRRGVIALGYLIALVGGQRSFDGIALPMAAVLAAGPVLSRTSSRRAMLDRRLPTGAGWLLAATLAGVHLVPTAIPGGGAVPVGLVYQAVLVLVAVTLAASAVGLIGRRRSVADLVVELGDRRDTTLSATLAAELGDPSLQIGLWSTDRDEFVDQDGRRLEPPTAGAGRGFTRIEQAGQPVAVIVHDQTALQEPAVAAAVARAATLEAENARLRATVSGQVDDLRASRARLVQTEEGERRLLEQRLQDGAGTRLATIDRLLEASTGVEPSSSLISAQLQLARDQVARARVELVELGQGIHPRALTDAGLEGSLGELADRMAIPVDLRSELNGRRLPANVEASVYFLCSEALANTVKHAQASQVVVELKLRNGRLIVRISDDGVGGTDPDIGTGLLGLVDRVQAVGGTLSIDSPAGHGTRLTAEIPLDDEAH